MNYPKEAFAWLDERKYNKYSQFGEDGLLEAIFERIGTANKWVMECGAADGVFFSNSKKLIDEGWSGLLIEGDGALYEKLLRLNENRQDVQCVRSYVDVVHRTLETHLHEAQSPIDLDLAVIDVDGQDYWLFNSLLKYRPRVVMVEYDPNADPDFVPAIDGEGQAGLQAIIKLGIGKLYYPVCATWSNVIFVQQELVSMVAASPEDWERVWQSVQAQVETWSRLIKDADSIDAPVYGFIGTRGAGELDNQPTIIEPPVTVDGDNCASLPVKVPFTTPSAPKVAAVISIPQLGHNVHNGCVLESLMPFGIGLRQCYGVYWNQALSEGIMRVLEQKPDYVLTLDYDALFTSKHVSDLMTLALDNPDVDVIIPCMTKREGNGLLAHTSNQDPSVPGVNLNDPLIPIQLGHFGLTLFKASVFDRIKKPWMIAVPNKDGDWGEGHIDADMNFWLNCEASGIKVMLARHVRVGHIEYMATIPNAEDPRKTDYVHVGEWRKWAVLENQVVNDRLQKAKETHV